MCGVKTSISLVLTYLTLLSTQAVLHHNIRARMQMNIYIVQIAFYQLVMLIYCINQTVQKRTKLYTSTVEQ